MCLRETAKEILHELYLENDKNCDKIDVFRVPFVRLAKNPKISRSFPWLIVEAEIGMKLISFLFARQSCFCALNCMKTVLCSAILNSTSAFF